MLFRKFKLLIILISVITILPFDQLGLGTVDSFAQTPEQEAVKETLVAMWAAIEAGDINKYASYIHPDITVFGENDTYMYEGKDKEVNNIGNWIKTSNNVHTEMHQPKVTVRGDTAWISYYWTDSGVSNGESFATRGKSTRIFVKERGKWLCIHGHYTAVQ